VFIGGSVFVQEGMGRMPSKGSAAGSNLTRLLTDHHVVKGLSTDVVD
jgi:hypothetical protein